MNQMTTDEAREVIVGMHAEGKAAETIKLTNEMFDALEIAIESLDQQVKLDAIFEQPKADDDLTVDEYLASLQPAPSHSMDLDDIADEIDNELIRYATEESEYWHHWRIGVMDGLKKAQSMMSAPVYHYLPEVPENNRRVVGYSDEYDTGFPVYFDNGIWSDVETDEDVEGIYAWCEIPPKPPVKEGGSDGNG